MASSPNSDLEALSAEVSRLSKIVASQGSQAYSDVRKRASNVYDAAAPQASKAAEMVKSEGTAMLRTARDHPTAVGGVVLVAAIAGALLGYVLASSSPESHDRNWWR